MAQDARKRQKQLERKSAKRKTRQQLVSKHQNAGSLDRLELAAKGPIVDCVAIGDVAEDGITSILLSRRLPNGSVAVATFVVDAYCLGLKDASAFVNSNFQYLDKGAQIRSARRMMPAAVRKLVEGAIDYARSIGFEPHPEYRKAKLLLSTIDANECTEEFTFGQDGKPYFFAGPNDNEARCRQILNTLKRTCGDGNFHFTIPIVPGGPIAMPANPDMNTSGGTTYITDEGNTR